MRTAPFLQHSHAFLRGTIAKLSFREEQLQGPGTNNTRLRLFRGDGGRKRRAPIQRWRTRCGTTCIRDYRDNIPDSGPLCEKASDAGCTDGMAATPRRKKKGLKRRKETPRKRTDGWNRISSRENIFRDNSEMTGSSIEVSFEEYF